MPQLQIVGGGKWYDELSGIDRPEQAISNPHPSRSNVQATASHVDPDVHV